MNKKEIEDLIRFVSKSGVTEVSLELKDVKITIKNAQKVIEHVVSQAAPTLTTAPAAIVHNPPAPVSAQSATNPMQANNASTNDESKFIVIKAPMIGTFYRSAGPEKPNFINVGDEIKEGKVICIIEAMKLFNEIESEVSGKIVKVLVDNSTPVEYDQPLFLIDPS